MVPLKKKPNATECSDERSYNTLIMHVSKILLNILTKRIESKVATINYIGEDQYGFCKGRRTRVAITCSEVWEKEVWSLVRFVRFADDQAMVASIATPVYKG